MNDREPISRSLLIRHAGWLSAGLCTLTALLYCCCGPTIGARAGGILPMGFSDGDEAELPADQVVVGDYVEDTEAEEVTRALFEEDPSTSQSQQIRPVSLWPLVKKPAAATAKASGLPRDPFAEAEQKALSAAVARKPVATGTPGRKPIAPTTAGSRRRLKEYQAQSQDRGSEQAPDTAAVAEKSEPAVKAQAPVKVANTSVAGEQPAAKSSSPATLADFDLDKPVAATETPAAPLDSAAEERLRALFEEGAAGPESPEAKDHIQQVSEADAAPSKVAVPAEQNTEMPTEALLYRTRQARQRGRGESSRAPRLASEKTELQAADKNEVPAEVDSKPVLPETEIAPVAKPKLADSESASPIPGPQAEQELAGKANVDHEAEVAAPEAKSVSPAVIDQEPAFIGDSTPAADQPGTATAESPTNTEVEPVIRPARPALPPIQVVANRPLELPPPPGWTAAQASEQRRVARLAALVNSTTVERPVRRVAAVDLPVANHAPLSVAQPSPFEAEPQGYTAPVVRAAVTLDMIDDAVNIIQNAEQVVENAVAVQAGEPESAEAAAEGESPVPMAIEDIDPEVVPEYAAHGQPTWLLYWLTGAGLMFGLYGLWSGWIRRSA